MNAPRNTRDLLTAIGIGQYNATMIITTMMLAPATTDPKAAQVILIVEHLQKTLFGMGATDVVLSGRLDAPTAAALEQVCGPDWMRMSWSKVVADVVKARDLGLRLDTPEPIGPSGEPIAVGDTFDFLPAVPGGIVTYAAAGYLAYRMFFKSKGGK
jgi:hypothetical protein